ncbi:hypothetical protein PENSPDRAFT_753438 [Peniophora sp. CONT]|nr:hypothetical protein PENSPDRAFT_753438 [Peniophora sp. CONT]
MPRAPPAESDLSLSRINRLLRSLRSKCAALTAGTSTSADPYTRSRITDYARATGQGGEWDVEDSPPLAVFDDPKKLAGRALDRRSMMNMRSCKLVHDVVEAWKNVLQAAFPSPTPVASNCHIQSLTGICAAIVGRSMVGDAVDKLDTEDSDDSDSDEDDESDAEGAEMAATQELYDAVPSRYRSWTFVSHSLALLLGSCPHNPTLLSCLLDLALSRRLVQESRSILSAFLSLCVQPASANIAPPLAHPSHTEFLKELCSRWTKPPSPSPSAIHIPSSEDTNANPHFSKVTFVDTFVSALVDTRCHEAWTCKSTARFARELRQSDPLSYSMLCAGLMDALTCVTPTSDDDRPERLALWLDSLPEQCYVAGEDAHTTILRLLCAAQAADLQDMDTTRLGANAPMRMLQSALTSSAVRCLSTPLTPSNGYMRGRVIALLRSTPSTATLDNVVGPCFDLTALTTAESLASSQALTNTLDTISQRLRVLASALREQTLAKLEMSLWTCALRHFQRLKLPEGSNSRASIAFRQTLVDARMAADGYRAAEDAEVERSRLQNPTPSTSRRPSPDPESMDRLNKPRLGLGSVTSVPVHRPMRFQSASTTTSPITTPRKPRAAKPPRRSEPAEAQPLMLASLNTVSLKLLEHCPSDEDGDDDGLAVHATPRNKRTTRRRAPRKTEDSDSGSDWGRENGLRGTKRRRSEATPRARRRDSENNNVAGDTTSPLAKRKRGAATPRARALRAPSPPEMSSGSESEESGSDWGREHGGGMAKNAAPTRGRRRKGEDGSDSGSDWERDRRARPREASRAGGSAPVQRRARATSKRRASQNVALSSRESDSDSPTESPVLFKSLLAEAARRRVSLRDVPASSPRIVRRRRIVLDSEDESGLDEPVRNDSDSDIEIVVDVPTKARTSTGAAGDDALDLFMYE